MRQNSGSRSPSGWHDDAIRNRDAGHDEMQALVLRWSKSQKGNPIKRGGIEFFPENSWIEHPIMVGGRIGGYADVATAFLPTEDNDTLEYRLKHGIRDRYFNDALWIFTEVKPVIGSVGAVVRQVKAIQSLVSGSALRAEVTAAVYADDPKLSLLQEVGGIRICTFDRPLVLS